MNSQGSQNFGASAGINVNRAVSPQVSERVDNITVSTPDSIAISPPSHTGRAASRILESGANIAKTLSTK